QRSSKHQAPTRVPWRQWVSELQCYAAAAGTAALQKSKFGIWSFPEVWSLKLEVWNFSGAWMLVLGVLFITSCSNEQSRITLTDVKCYPPAIELNAATKQQRV